MAPPPIPTAPARNSEILTLCRAIRTTTHHTPSYLRCRNISNLAQHGQEQQFLFNHAASPVREISQVLPLKAVISPQRQEQSRLSSSYVNLSAKQRYGIAAAVAWSVLHLGGGPWLDNGLHCDQMSPLLESTASGQHVPAAHPCIVQSFHMRRKQVRSSSENTSQGPSAMTSHIPNATIFALGVLLIELCINEPLRVRHSPEAPTQAASMPSPTISGTETTSWALEFDDEDYLAARARIDDVYRTAGDSYGFAAERCIKHVFVGPEAYKSFEFTQFRKQFYEVVVAPVQATYQQMPGNEMWS